MYSFVVNLRTAALCLAILAFGLNGASAHIVKPVGDTVSVLICGATTGPRYVDIVFGDEGPIAPAEGTKCEMALASAPPLPLAPSLPTRLMASYTCDWAIQLINACQIRFSFWPGAPPIGPPNSRKV